MVSKAQGFPAPFFLELRPLHNFSNHPCDDYYKNYKSSLNCSRTCPHLYKAYVITPWTILFRSIIPPQMHHINNKRARTSQVAQWLRIRLPMQGTRGWALVWEDPTCHGATKPMCHNGWVCALESASRSYWARAPQLLKPTCLEPVLHHKRSHRNEKPAHRNE